MTTAPNKWAPPQINTGALENYRRRRATLLSYLSRGMSVKEIANLTDRCTAAVYTDITKLQTETETYTIWGAIMESMRRGWIECPQPPLNSSPPPGLNESGSL
jgi:DNA-binding NarL/FixJ family response regulator